MPEWNTVALREALAQRLNLDELKDAASDLGVDYEGLDKRELARRLVRNLYQRGQLDELINWLNRNRLDINTAAFAFVVDASPEAGPSGSNLWGISTGRAIGLLVLFTLAAILLVRVVIMPEPKLETSLPAQGIVSGRVEPTIQVFSQGSIADTPAPLLPIPPALTNSPLLPQGLAFRGFRDNPCPTVSKTEYIDVPLRKNGKAIVVWPGADGVWLRQQPFVDPLNRSSNVLATLCYGHLVEVIDGPRWGEGMLKEGILWWIVRSPSQGSGWAAEKTGWGRLLNGIR